MKMLVDQNISFRLLPLIRSDFPDASHVRDLGLIDFDDIEIFNYASINGFDAILTLDEDFYNIQLTWFPA
jgi:predicted nuclease of predicted toxin-antitoxin system